MSMTVVGGYPRSRLMDANPREPLAGILNLRSSAAACSRTLGVEKVVAEAEQGQGTPSWTLQLQPAMDVVRAAPFLHATPSPTYKHKACPLYVHRNKGVGVTTLVHMQVGFM